jgi:hypothetical protein
MNLTNKFMGSRREQYRDFVERYDQGAPYDNISDEEAINCYREVAPQLSDEDYRYAAREALSQMTAEERTGFGRQLRDQTLQQGYDFPDRDMDDQDARFQNPNYLAQVTGTVCAKHPGLLESTLGSGGAGLVGGMLGDGITGGEGASGGDSMTDNFLAKVAIAAIPAMAIKRALDGG